MTRAAILLLLSLSGCATADLSRPARANIAALISNDDYPPSALRAEEQGTVGFRLEVDPQGRVTQCTVTASSGSANLDAATCRLMQRRAQFEPALDRKGRPTSGTVTSQIRWVIPDDEPEAE